VIHEDKFLISRRLYAVDFDGMTVKETQGVTHYVSIRAVWFRRRRGVTVACIGCLWDIMRDPKPMDVREALERMDDGRYGGTCVGRWDGTGYWGAEDPTVAARHLEVLRPMLANLPDRGSVQPAGVPAGFSGWWRYETDQENAAKRQETKNA
jgi:hypothetical protein